MKISTLSRGAAAIFGLIAMTATLTYGQTPVETRTTTTVSSTGTVNEFTPNEIAVKVDNSDVPVRYTFSKTTTYVDENGNPVSVEMVKTGTPVVVYYEKNGDSMVADKVVVKRLVSTTTEASTPPPAVSQPPPAVDGIVATSDSDEISIRTGTSAGRIHYKAHDATAYVDENGNPVSRSTLKEGTPVTIFYERDGDQLLATRVIVKNPVSIEKTTTTTEETTVPR